MLQTGFFALICQLERVVLTTSDRNDLRFGRARKYHRAMKERYQLMASTKSDTVALLPLPAFPVSLVLNDLSYKSSDMFNDCWAGYFYRKGMKLHESPAQAAEPKSVPLRVVSQL